MGSCSLKTDKEWRIAIFSSALCSVVRGQLLNSSAPKQTGYQVYQKYFVSLSIPTFKYKHVALSTPPISMGICLYIFKWLYPLLWKHFQVSWRLTPIFAGSWRHSAARVLKPFLSLGVGRKINWQVTFLNLCKLQDIRLRPYRLGHYWLKSIHPVQDGSTLVDYWAQI